MWIWTERCSGPTHHCSGADGRFSLMGVRALEACARAGVEVVLYSGRKQSSVFESARLIGFASYIFELGCGLVLDGELEWLTGGLEPSAELGSIHDQIEASGAPGAAARALRRAARVPHAVGGRARGLTSVPRTVDLDEAHAILAEAGLIGSGSSTTASSHEHAGAFPDAEIVHVYHLIPAIASKAHAVARHMQARGYAPGDCIAVGDSREDMEAASVVGASGSSPTRWSATRRSPTMCGGACDSRPSATAQASTRR